MSAFFDLDLGGGASSGKKRTRRGVLSVETCHQQECGVCPLNGQHGVKNPHMEPSGSEEPLVYMLGEAPGAQEDVQGEQFVGESGKIIRAQIPSKYVEDLRWNNCVRTRPPKNRTPTWTEIECCRPSVVKDIEETRPKAIFGFGGVPLYWATGEDSGIYKWRGRHFPIKVGDHVCWFFPMLHPAGLLRMRKRTKSGGALKSEAEFMFERDIKSAFKLLQSLPEPKIIDPVKKNATTETPLSLRYRGVKIVTGARGRQDLKVIKEWFTVLLKEESFALDLETASEEKIKDRQLHPYGKGGRILSVSLATDKESLAFPFEHPGAGWTKSQLRELKVLLTAFLIEARSVTKVAQNLRFELEWFSYFFGMEVMFDSLWGDTMAQAYLLDNRSGMLSLDVLTLIHFGFSLKSVVKVDRGNLAREPLEKVLVYNALDSLYEQKLFLVQRALLEKEGLCDIYDFYPPAVRATTATQLFGNEIDFSRVLDYNKRYSEKLKALEGRIKNSKAAKKFEARFKRPFKPTSHPDVATMFRDVLKRDEGWVTEKDGQEKYKADDEVLKKIDHPMAGWIKDLRAYSGNKAKYVDPLHPETGECVFPDKRIHPNLNLYFTDTGRTSSSFPNEQYWPKRDDNFKDLRSTFVAEQGCVMVAIDQGQIEARVIAMASRDRRYGEYLWERHDVHMDWARRLAHAYPARIGGKAFLKDPDVMKRFRYDIKNQWTFPLFFGAHEYSVAGYLDIPKEVVSKQVSRFWDEFSGVKEWQEELEQFYRKHGYVECLTGRRRRGPISYNEIINSPIQGTASDITVSAYSRLSEAAWGLQMWQYLPRLEVHDELVFQIPKKTLDRDIEFIVGYLLDCDHFPFINVPLCVEVNAGPNWFKMEKVSEVFSDDLGKIDRKACGF